MTDRERSSEELGSRREVITETEARETGTRRHGTDSPVMGKGADFLRGITWGAVFAGAFVAFAVMTLLNILGFAIGAAVFDPGVAQEGFGIGAGIWWTVAVLIALFCGGWVAGRLSDSMDRGEGLLHGVVMWSLFIVASVVALTTAVGTVLGGAFGVLGQQISALLGQPQIIETVEGALIQAGVTDVAAAEVQAEMIIAADQAATAVAAAATWAFIALLLGVLCAALGSLIGAALPPHEGEERVERTKRVFRPRHA